MSELYCKYLNNSICFNEDKILFCTIGNDGQNRKLPTLLDNFDGNIEKFKEAISKIKEYKRLLKENIFPDFCEECHHLTQIENNSLGNNEEFKYVLFSNWYKCNSKCIYCQKPLRNDIEIDSDKEPVYNIIPIIKNMIENNMITKNTIIDFAGAGGEPTLYKYFDEAIELLLSTPIKKLVVHTNAIKYNSNIEKAIRKGVMDISVSIDAGSKEVHGKIKQVDTYEKVWKNIKKYAKAKSNLSDNLIISKYIIIPGYNDTNEEIKMWIDKSKEAGVTKLILNADDRIFQAKNKNQSTIEKIVEITDFFTKVAKENCYRYELYYGVYLAYLFLNQVEQKFIEYVPSQNSL